MGAFASKEEFMGAIKSIVGDNNSDDVIAFIENASDTYDELVKSSAPSEEQTDWQKKYEENDAEWRKKYTERFFSGNAGGETKDMTKTEPDKSPAETIEGLFKERS